MSTTSTSPTGSTNSPQPLRKQRIARKRALFQVTVLENPWIPDPIKNGITPKQAEFLCYEGREALFGGAAGGGKSVALLVAALQFVEQTGYSALILRRTYKQLAKSDSILNKAKEWLIGRANSREERVRWNGDDYKFTFPSGATLEFGHIEHEDAKLNYQGGAWSFIGVDECTQFTESMISYPRTRQRRPVGSSIPVRWRGASNPGGIGHEYIKARYVKDSDGKSPCTPDRQFFPARLDDNPHIDREDYLKQLRDSGIDPLTLAQLEQGDWDAVAGGRFKREWFDQSRYTTRGDYVVLRRTGEATERTAHIWGSYPRFLTIDPAASAKTTADWTVIAGWLQTPQNELVLLDIDRFQADSPDIPPRVDAMYRKWRCSGAWIEAVGANDAVYKLCSRLPIAARRLNPLGQDKLVRATEAMNLAASGRIWFPLHARPGMPLLELEAELYRFTGDDRKDAHDDCCDALSYAAKVLVRGPTVEERKQVPYAIGGR